jgi:hypothetical protein
VGVDLDTFDIGAIDEGCYYVKFHLCNKDANFKWALVGVYGPDQNPQKEKFFIELVHMMSHEKLPILMGGDFNILRHAQELITPRNAVGFQNIFGTKFYSESGIGT